MQANASALEKKAIKQALQEDWKSAIETNIELLELDPKNMKAKMRLGKAYLQTKEFTKAEKIFEEVLEIDAINQIAKKNYELAKSKKTQNNVSATNKKSMLKEPGTTEEVKMSITAPRMTANSFSYGTELKLDILKTKINVIKDKTTIGSIEDEKIVKNLNYANKLNSKIEAYYIKGKDKEIDVLLRSSEPVFKGDKQDVKPYLKKGAIAEPELEIESFDDE